MELTDKNATGNFSKFEFVKGASSVVTPQDIASFSSVSIVWEASGAVDIHEIASQENIQVSPNPSKNIFHITGKNIAEIEILDLTGALIFKNNITTEVDMSNLKSGIYLVKITSDSGIVVKKLFKE